LVADERPTAAPSLEAITSACGHHNFADALFLQGFQLLTEGGLAGKRVLEVCCGLGMLANWLAAHGAAEVVAIDSDPESIAVARTTYAGAATITFRCGDALDLSEFPDESFDIVVGQATLHHLTNNLPKASREFRRVLRPGGRCLFIFEPLGHNPVFAAIRAAVNSRKHYLDESMLFQAVFERFGEGFVRYEVYPFGLTAYPCKALPKRRSLSRLIYRTCNRIDQELFKLSPRLGLLAANCNVCYWK
jgi:ubiquinone/menaquinone biosynthesis C-methylase UbiE